MRNKFKSYLEKAAQSILQVPVDDSYERAVKLILACKGKLFTTGIGKAGYIAKKAASTFSTTGTPAVYLHPADASHGDVGAVAPGDVLLAYSNSGRTREVIETVSFCRHLGISAVVTVSASHDSPLAELSNEVLAIGTIEESCPFGLTPTSSTAAMLAVSDALALILMEERNFTRRDWADRHHGGYLGQVSREEK